MSQVYTSSVPPTPGTPPPPPYSPPSVAPRSQVPFADFSKFDLQLWSTCGTAHHAYHTACRIGRFVLLGTSVGEVQALDTEQGALAPRPILWQTARQLVVLGTSQLLLVLPERTRKVRCYSLSAIMRLCYGVFGVPWTKELDDQYPLPPLAAWLASSSSSSSSSASISSMSAASTSFSTSSPPMQPIPYVPDASVKLATRNLNRKLLVWGGKAIPLQDYCYKLANTKDGLSLHTYQTSAYLFVATLHPNKIELWQCHVKSEDALMPPLLLPLKAFWIPAEAHTISFADDRATLKHIITVFTTGAAMITLRTSKVEAIPIDQQLVQLYQQTIRSHRNAKNAASTALPPSSGSLSMSATQQASMAPSVSSSAAASASIPPATTAASSVPASNASTPGSSDAAASSRRFHRPPQLASAFGSSAPSLPWTSLVQLPCYPDQLPGLTTKFTLPPSYNAVIQHTPYQPFDPVAIPSNVAPQLFLATFGKYSMVIDSTGALFSTQVYRWHETLVHVAFVQAGDQQWYMVGFGKTSVTLMHLLSAQSHRLMNELPVRFLGQHDATVFWSCQHDKLHQVYYLYLN
ncbi:hypothetical protein BC940DRAFT_321451 [Gongronella butleri]|nr:hypothetical protein BC940DRAFT_321451 [Gongronella butleri]